MEIRGRFVPKRGVIRSATGDEINVESELLTEAVVTTDDLVEGSAVRRVEEVVDKLGKTIAYRVFL